MTTKYTPTHSELCELTAERFRKDSSIVLCEYQSWASGEFPDVLCYQKDKTVLYEIKVSRSDFLADQKKECRTKWKNRNGYFFQIGGKQELYWQVLAPDIMFIEKPHLGKYRYYVCPSGLIKPEEVPNGWGLYWYKNGKFYQKKESFKFVRNIHEEISILTHAMRRYANGQTEYITVNMYNGENL
jgi:hypothetical protein